MSYYQLCELFVCISQSEASHFFLPTLPPIPHFLATCHTINAQAPRRQKQNNQKYLTMKYHSNSLSLAVLFALLMGGCSAAKVETKDDAFLAVDEDESFWGRNLGVMTSMSIPVPPPTDAEPTGEPPSPPPPTPTPTPQCQNGILDPGEQCDPSAPISDANSCPGGQMCSPQCNCVQFIEPTPEPVTTPPTPAPVEPTTPPTPVCQNGVLDPGEECDPSVPDDADGNTCPDGETCSNDCTCVAEPTPAPVDTTPPPTPICQNGILDPGEECDPSAPMTDDNSCPDGEMCSADCTCVVELEPTDAPPTQEPPAAQPTPRPPARRGLLALANPPASFTTSSLRGGSSNKNDKMKLNKNIMTNKKK